MSTTIEGFEIAPCPIYTEGFWLAKAVVESKDEAAVCQDSNEFIDYAEAEVASLELGRRWVWSRRKAK